LHRKYRGPIAIGISILILVGLVWKLRAPLPSFANVQASYVPSDTWILDYRGAPLASLRTSEKNRSLGWLSLKDVSPAFVALLIQAEDKRFNSHHGVDWRALGYSVATSLFRSQSRGASTISMQLARLIKKNERTLTGKVSQVLDALRLESLWSKSEILEAYINLVAFRGTFKKAQWI
jgi:penicillin-binding protein 1C